MVLKLMSWKKFWEMHAFLAVMTLGNLVQHSTQHSTAPERPVFVCDRRRIVDGEQLDMSSFRTPLEASLPDA
jgi:hypothetical protein